MPEDKTGPTLPDAAIKPEEQFFPAELVSALKEINVARDCNVVFDIVVRYAKSCGFHLVLYEYCHDYERDNEMIFVRSNLPRAIAKFEQLFRGRNRIGKPRLHARDHLTPIVMGSEFSDIYAADGNYLSRTRTMQLLMGVKSGFAIPLRTQSVMTRTGWAFGSRRKREKCLEVLEQHSMPIGYVAWHAHIKIMQIQSEQMVIRELTPNQQLYLELLCAGYLDKQIAGRLQISHSGVRKYQNAVARKLGVSQRTQIVAEAFRRGLIEENGRIVNPEKADLWDMIVTTDE